MHLKTSFLRVMENPAPFGEKHKKKKCEGFAYDCQLGSNIPELVEIKFTCSEKEVLPDFFYKCYQKNVPCPIRLAVTIKVNFSGHQWSNNANLSKLAWLKPARFSIRHNVQEGVSKIHEDF